MPLSREFYDHIPFYIRLADEEEQILRHICDAIQVEYNRIFSLLEQRQYWFNPDLCPPELLDFLGQATVGLARTQDGHWLGTGLNPNWEDAYKREVIKRAGNYWRIHGTSSGVKEGIDLWLRVPKERVTVTLPWGKEPQVTPPLWFGHNIPLNTQSLLDFRQKRRLGSGDNFPGKYYHPVNFVLLERDESLDEVVRANYLCRVVEDLRLETSSAIENAAPLEPSSPMEVAPGILPSNRICFLDLIRLGYIESPPTPQYSRSHLGPYNPWMFLDLTEANWNQAIPDITTLNWELWGAMATPVVFAQLAFNLDYEIAQDPNFPRLISRWTYEATGLVYGDAGATTYPYTLPRLGGDTCSPGVEIDETTTLCNIYTLNETEITATEEKIQLSEAERPYTEIYPILKRIYAGNGWRLLLETDTHTYGFYSTSKYWQNQNGERSRWFTYTDSADDFSILELEFVIRTLEVEEKLQDLKLLLDGVLLFSQVFNTPLTVSQEVCLLLKFTVNITEQPL